jgi:predicted permease
MLNDVRYAIRVLIKNPGFSLVAILSLALGIGANTAIFSMINSLLLAPLPVERPSELVSIFTTDTKNPGPLPVSHYNFIDYRDQNSVFSGVTAYNFAQVNLNKGPGESVQLFGNIVSGNYFEVLGVKFALGRGFFPDEDRTPGANPVVVLSDACWNREFGGDTGIVGQTISLNRRDFTVVGVAPRDFTGLNIGGGPDFWAPMMMHSELQPDMAMFYNGRRGLAFLPVGRLKEGTSLQQAQAELTGIAASLEKEYPKDNEGRGVQLIPLLEARTNPGGEGELENTFIILMSVVGIVLLIACANVTNLLLARGARRAREISIRVAIGASRTRLIRQLVTESLVLSLVGGAVGLLAAFWTRSIISSLMPFDFAGDGNNEGPPLDWKVMLFALAISVVSGLIFGLVPAFHGSRPDLVPALKGEATMPLGRKGLTLILRKALVVLQVALSLFALIAAGLFVRSLQKAMEVNPGFVTENLILFGFNLGREGYSEAQGKQFHRDLLDRIPQLPGVRAATVARDRPVNFGFSRSVFIEGQEPPPGGRGLLVQTNDIGPRYFETMGIPLLGGRDFGETDTETSPKVVIINDSMAKRFWPGDEAVGKRFKFFGDQDYREVVGVARDSKIASLVENQRPYVYIPLRQEYPPQITLHVRTSGDTKGTIAAVRGEVQRHDPSLTVLNVQTLEERVHGSLQGQRSQATLLGSAGLLALVLAAVGVYGVMAYLVAQRTREIGIRMALGAGKRQVLGMVLREGATMVSIGLGIGLVSAFVVTSIIFAGALFNVSARDPLTFAVTAVVLLVVSLLATYIPARRAAKVDPIRALRYE